MTIGEQGIPSIVTILGKANIMSMQTSIFKLKQNYKISCLDDNGDKWQCSVRFGNE